ncbi:DMT family transporter [Candidatus Puniceispirillum sp.]|nr:DMT family transporter [Candidatus Puniceispirillum sp.]
MTWLISLFTREYSLGRALLIIFISSSFWGVLWMPMRHVESMGLSSLWVVTMFHFFPAIVMLPMIFSTTNASHEDWFRASIAGLLVGAGFVFYALGLIVSSVTKTVVLFYMTPIWSTIFAYFVIKERVGLARWLAIFGGIAGCALVMDVNGQTIHFNAADLLGLFSGIFWALGSVAVRRFNKINFLHVTFLQYLFGGFMVLGAVLYIGDPTPTVDVFLRAAPIAFLTSALIFLPTALFVFRIMQYVSPGLVGILMLSEALIAALSAAIWLEETLSQSQWLGVITILTIGVLIGFHEGKSKDRKKAD